MRLRYTGPQPTVFNHPQAGAVEPGDTFWVDDADASPFLARADVEPANDEEPNVAAPAQAPRSRKRKTPDTAPEPDGDDSPTPADAQNP